MRPDEIEIGDYYVMEGSGVIRHFYDVTLMGKAWYRAYDMYSGEYIYTNHCRLEFLVNRSERRATPEEIRRLDQPNISWGLVSTSGRPLRQALHYTGKN